MISPTIGRIVWFTPSDADWTTKAHMEGQPYAAMVVGVHNDELVNLVAFDANGQPFSATAVKLWQGEGDRPRGPFAEWPQKKDDPANKAEPKPISQGPLTPLAKPATTITR